MLLFDLYSVTLCGLISENEGIEKKVCRLLVNEQLPYALMYLAPYKGFENFKKCTFWSIFWPESFYKTPFKEPLLSTLKEPLLRCKISLSSERGTHNLDRECPALRIRVSYTKEEVLKGYLKKGVLEGYHIK